MLKLFPLNLRAKKLHYYLTQSLCYFHSQNNDRTYEKSSIGFSSILWWKWIKFLESWLQLQHLLASHEEHDESYFIEMHCINGNLFHKDTLCLSGPNSFHLLIFFIGSEAEELKCKCRNMSTLSGFLRREYTKW